MQNVKSVCHVPLEVHKFNPLRSIHLFMPFRLTCQESYDLFLRVYGHLSNCEKYFILIITPRCHDVS